MEAAAPPGPPPLPPGLLGTPVPPLHTPNSPMAPPVTRPMVGEREDEEEEDEEEDEAFKQLDESQEGVVVPRITVSSYGSLSGPLPPISPYSGDVEIETGPAGARESALENLSDDDEEDDQPVVPALALRKSDVDPQDAHRQLVQNIPSKAAPSLVPSVAAHEYIDVVRDSSAYLSGVPVLITFKTTIKRGLGRSPRQLDVDIVNRTVTQINGSVRKVVPCHKFVNVLPSGGHEADLVATVLEGKNAKATKSKVWRFREKSEAQRFQNLIHMLNTSGMKLLEIFHTLDRDKKGYVTVMDVLLAASALQMEIDEVGVRTMLMLARTLATVQTKSNVGTSTGQQFAQRSGSDPQVMTGSFMLGMGAPGSSSTLPRGGMGGGGAHTSFNTGLSVDFATFLELFAHINVPVTSVEECLYEWHLKYEAVAQSSGKHSATSTLKQISTRVEFPELLPGEQVFSLSAKGEREMTEMDGIRYSLGPPGAMPPLYGHMRLSNYRIILKATHTRRGARHRLPESFEETHVPYNIIARVEASTSSQIAIWCKDLRLVTISTKHSSAVPRIMKLIQLRAFPGGVMSDHFAFLYKEDFSHVKNGWDVYDPIAEFERVGVLTGVDSHLWQVIDNSIYRKSPTYPSHFVLPSALNYDEFKDAAKFRSKKRLPVLTWRDPVTRACLVRSSQPLSGVTGARSPADEKLLNLYRCFGDPLLLAEEERRGQANTQLFIVDCRGALAATGNKLQGKGVENAAHYTNASLKYSNIGNIHTMRNSLAALADIVAPTTATTESASSHFLSNLEQTGWIEHIRLCLLAAVDVAEKLRLEGSTVLLHCSDGWDRTAQVSCMAQMLLDPYYRTIEGFAVLVEKDWCAFGHKFTDRCGHGVPDKSQDRSPIFVQFLDLCSQVLKQFPDVFEFDERLLVFLADHIFSGLFGTFLGNNERERKFELKCHQRTVSIWTYVFAFADHFTNPRYRVDRNAIWPSTSVKKLGLWARYYSRWDPDVHPRYDKGSEHAWHDDWGTVCHRTDLGDLQEAGIQELAAGRNVQPGALWSTGGAPTQPQRSRSLAPADVARSFSQANRGT